MAGAAPPSPPRFGVVVVVVGGGVGGDGVVGGGGGGGCCGGGGVGGGGGGGGEGINPVPPLPTGSHSFLYAPTTLVSSPLPLPVSAGTLCVHGGREAPGERSRKMP